MLNNTHSCDTCGEDIGRMSVVSFNLREGGDPVDLCSSCCDAIGDGIQQTPNYMAHRTLLVAVLRFAKENGPAVDEKRIAAIRGFLDDNPPFGDAS